MGKNTILWQIGVDEAGRGPLAGPVYVAAIRVKKGVSIAKLFSNTKDSKKLSEKRREEIYKHIVREVKRGTIFVGVGSSSAKVIDKIGIVPAVAKALSRAIKKISGGEKNTEVFLDGSLKAPRQYIHQKTIIKGDEKVPLIALASIVAKVRRDRRMKALSKKFPDYDFHVHKGYGTSAHYTKIKKHGFSDIHRRSFLKNVKVGHV